MYKHIILGVLCLSIAAASNAMAPGAGYTTPPATPRNTHTAPNAPARVVRHAIPVAGIIVPVILFPAVVPPLALAPRVLFPAAASSSHDDSMDVDA